MTYEKALAVSRELAENGVAHTVSVGHHPQYGHVEPTELPAVQARVDLPWPRGRIHALGDEVIHGRSPSLVETVTLVETIARRHDCALETGIMSEGLTISNLPKRTA